MAPSLLEWGLRSGHLAAVADCVGDDRVGAGGVGGFGLQVAQEAEDGGAAGEGEEGEVEFVSSAEDVVVV